ncbi:Hypothetical predicted protein [Pelobates cultripes]|uniref:Uncharacterized protein n=1 Tax=Pelobates cultripes TaxID=61616 RepID=A0AAD1T128_PELCU|nr:Hypothetical predicted protein [Pelobates cultripes]
MQSTRYKIYLSLLTKLDVLISQGGDPEDILAVKALMRSYQYDRYASLVKERDHRSFHLPNPFLSCKRKTITCLWSTDGILEESPHGILGKSRPQMDEAGKSRGCKVDEFLSELTLPEYSDLPFGELLSEITIEEVSQRVSSWRTRVSRQVLMA